MAISDEQQDDGTRWEGYSNYQKVSSRMSESVDSAVESYSLIQSAHKEGATVSEDLVANARSDILGAAIPLFVEMQQEQERGVDEYDEILGRWEGGENEEEIGYIRRLHETQLRDGMPGWLFQLVLDIRKAGWKLGYLQAGRRSKRDPDDPVEADSDNMFEGM